MLSTIDMAALADRLAKLDEVKGRSLWADARIRFARNKAAVVGVVLLIFCFAYAFFGQLVSPRLCCTNKVMDGVPLSPGGLIPRLQ